MAKGNHLKNYSGPRGRINKDDLCGLAVSVMVEFTMPQTGVYAYGKVIEFKRRPEGVLAEISVKALQQEDGSWVRYHDFYDFQYVLVSELTAAPLGMFHERVPPIAHRKTDNDDE